MQLVKSRVTITNHDESRDNHGCVTIKSQGENITVDLTVVIFGVLLAVTAVAGYEYYRQIRKVTPSIRTNPAGNRENPSTIRAKRTGICESQRFLGRYCVKFQS